MLQVYANENEGSLDIPLGAKLKIWYKNKNGKEINAPINAGRDKNHFICLFQDDDVDFEIEMTNASKDRSACFNMNILKKSYGFVTQPNKNFKIQTLSSNGRKLHFVRQSGKEGKELIAFTATNHGLTRQDASRILSEIEFDVKYSEPVKYSIYVQVGNGEKRCFEVNRLNTVADLKKMITSRMGIKSVHQILKFKGTQLHENESMENLRIIEHSMLDLKGLMVIPIEVKIVPNKSVQLEVNQLDTIEQLKAKMEAQHGIPAKQQSLHFRGDELHDSSRFVNIGIEENSKIFLATKSLTNYSKTNTEHQCSSETIISINVELPNHKVVTVCVCPLETIEELITIVHEKDGSFAENNKLQCFMSGKHLENHLTLEVYDVNDNCELKLRDLCSRNQHFCTVGKGQWLFVKTLTGKTTKYPFCGFDDIEMLKQKIFYQDGIPADQQRLMYSGKQLQDGRILNDYAIYDGSILHLILRLRGGGCSNCKNGIVCELHLTENNSKENLPGPDFSERGAITFGKRSEQIFSKCSFNPDYSVNIEPFIIELRLAGIPLLLE